MGRFERDLRVSEWFRMGLRCTMGVLFLVFG